MRLGHKQFIDLTVPETSIAEEIACLRESLETMNTIFLGFATQSLTGNRVMRGE